MSLQMAHGPRGGQWTLSVSRRGRKTTGTLLSTQRQCKIQSAENHRASVWLWDPQLTLQGEKPCPQSFTCVIINMVNDLNIHCDALAFSNRFRRGRESKQQFTLICRWAQLRGKKKLACYFWDAILFTERLFTAVSYCSNNPNNKVELLSSTGLYKTVCRWAVHYRAAPLIKVLSSSSYI